MERFEKIDESDVKTGRFVTFLYNNMFGSATLSVLSRPRVSKMMGTILNSRASRPLINKTISKRSIDMSLYEERKYKSYNDFFTRRIKDGLRPFDRDGDAFVSPCDSKLSVFEINEDSTFEIKDFEYTMEELLDSEELADEFRGGLLWVFRLDVDDYHHYYYIDSGHKGGNTYIGGRLHTVRPVALKSRKVFAECCREYTLIDTENFGRIAQMEIGAIMVGRIMNLHGECDVRRGEEKGYFEFGGSTVVIATHAGAVMPLEEIRENTKNGYETKVRAGERVGNKQK